MVGGWKGNEEERLEIRNINKQEGKAGTLTGRQTDRFVHRNMVRRVEVCKLTRRKAVESGKYR